MQADKIHVFPLRLTSKKQKNDIKTIAKKNNRSLNAHINSLIDEAISNEPISTFSKTK
jgi:hypothetical protein